MDKPVMKISELSRQSGVPRTTIHYYLRTGLLHPPVKTGKTMGYYDESHLARLLFISRLKDTVPGKFIKRMISEQVVATPSDEAPIDSDGAADRPSRALKRKQIIKASIPIFTDKGYRNATISDITHALGISIGAFYLYFKNKQEIFEAAVDHVLLDIIDKALAAGELEEDPLKRLFIQSHVFYANYRKYSEIINQLRGEMGSEAWARNKVRNVYYTLTRDLIQDVGALVAAGTFRRVDSELFAYTLVGIIEMMSLRLTFDNTYSYKKIDDFLMDLVVNGFPYVPPEK